MEVGFVPERGDMKQAFDWMWKISVCSLLAGFWACIGWDAARRLRLVELVQPWVQEALGT